MLHRNKSKIFFGSRGRNRQWTDEDMYTMMEKINRGFTYQDVTDGTHVPISTLWTRY